MLSLLLLAGCTAAEKPSDPIMGEYEGTITPQGAQAIKAEAKVIADEDGKHRIVLLYPAGDRNAARFELAGTGSEAEVAIVSANWLGRKLAEQWSGAVTEATLSIASGHAKGGKVEMKRMKRESPTLGQKPPAGAVVLLPFDEDKTTNMDQWSNPRWPCKPDGSIMVRGGDNKSRKEFGSFKLHVEFLLPFMPAARGEDRGNSGICLHGRYRVQVLDSFGLPTGDREGGAIFGQKAPDVNASLPPRSWQTYDIDFKSPQFDENDKQTRGALITVLWNGKKIHDAVEVKAPTPGGIGSPGKKGPICLKDHQAPVQFRNIWLVEAK
jgi:hypothetical protein